MDDIKRAIYLRAREIVVEQGELKYSHGGHLCTVLRTATDDVLGRRTTVEYQNTHQFICEFFPEFMALYDGWYWSRTSWRYSRSLQLESPAPSAAWWNSFWNAPRVCMIDYLLSR